MFAEICLPVHRSRRDFNNCLVTVTKRDYLHVILVNENVKVLQCTLLKILQNVLEKVTLSDCVTDKPTDKNVGPD